VAKLMSAIGEAEGKLEAAISWYENESRRNDKQDTAWRNLCKARDGLRRAEKKATDQEWWIAYVDRRYREHGSKDKPISPR